jgi:hypothetical protein
MDHSLISPERGKAELTLFGLGFGSLLTAIAGMVLVSPFFAVGGAAFALFVLLTFWVKSNAL